ncbi:MAG: GNAT family N-acetyltransferase [Limosilactobacillus oris]|uniref:GNAT family N-acetyltransferase n=1 Tax=Limosilactobacillus oris TaxID=1632 RepID=UPI002432DF5B|nr:GNAT family N-acetyltransferase [Limosilactobacillus oris]MCH3910690.1 GNAT family N-acetyltransferase [Limosilactobacillus oris]MCH3937942.1 GNAT family N-acetyltransferase [Limosilactobacillus oris]MCI1981154.1 GNAT family N-acetyltransferase [Limosilactobacillus oris]
MIRKMKPADLNAIMEIWLSSNLDAHSFVGRQYWQEQLPAVRAAIQDAEVYCYIATNDTIAGFIGLFVASKYRQQGIGSKLLAFVQGYHQQLTLDAYPQNQRAVAFYHRHGFVTSQQDATNVHMTWTAPE